MKHKVSELEGALLDAAVAKALRFDFRIGPAGKSQAHMNARGGQWSNFEVSKYWTYAGPIIQREMIALTPPDCGCCEPYTLWRAEIRDADVSAVGQTPIVAAMRCYVVSKLGAEIDLP